MKQGQLIIAVLLVCVIVPFSTCVGDNSSVAIEVYKQSVCQVMSRK